MKSSLLAGISLGAVALATGAQAADLPARPAYKAPVAAPVWNWTGFYVGGTLGGVWSRSSASSANYFGPGVDDNGTGVIGGLEAGYNWQTANWVLGIEGDISFSSLNRTASGFFGADTYQSRLDWLSTVRGRVGYAFDRWLVYGTGGGAFAQLKDAYTAPGFPFVAEPSSTVGGWTAGGGVEYAVADHWTVKAEYLHVGFSDRSVTEATSGFGYAFTFKDRIDIARVGINYKF